MSRSLTATSWAAPLSEDVTSRPFRAPGWNHENTFVFLVQEWPGAPGLHDREFRNTGVARVPPGKPYDRPTTTALKLPLRKGLFGDPPTTLPGHGPASPCPQTRKAACMLSRVRVWLNRTYAENVFFMDQLRRNPSARAVEIHATHGDADSPVLAAADTAELEPEGLSPAGYVEFALDQCQRRGIDGFVPRLPPAAIVAPPARLAPPGLPRDRSAAARTAAGGRRRLPRQGRRLRGGPGRRCSGAAVVAGADRGRAGRGCGGTGGR